MGARIQRIDLAVESIRQAENFYMSLFRLAVAYREVWAQGETSYIGPEVSCEEAQARGLRLERTVLGGADFQIALCRAPGEFGQRSRLEQVALRVDGADIAWLSGAAGELGCELTRHEDGRLAFRDPFGIVWDASAPGDRDAPPA